MSTQYSLLFSGTPAQKPLSREECLPPSSRTNDPKSSKRAEESAKRNGVMRGGRVLAMELVEKHPGMTSKQLAGFGTLDRYTLARRLPELLKMNLVRTTQTRSEDLKWWPRD